MTDTKIGKKTLTFIFLLIGSSLFLAGLAVVTVQGAYDQGEDVDLIGYAKVSWVQELQKWNKGNFETVIDAKGNRTMIMEDHAILIATVDDLKIEIAVLKAVSDVPGLPKPPREDSTDFRLELANAQGTFTSTFTRGDVLLVTGDSEYVKWNSRIVITDPNGTTVKNKTFNTYSDGTFTESFITDASTLLGQYTLTITIRNLTDTITFDVI